MAREPIEGRFTCGRVFAASKGRATQTPGEMKDLCSGCRRNESWSL